MFTYLKVQIESSNVEIKCFECNYELSEDFILDIIKKDEVLINKYNRFKERAKIYKDDSKKFCPEPDCNSYLQKGDNKYVQCENGHKYCYICLKPWHGRTNCDEEVDKDFQIWKKDKVVKQCPKCKIYTEKNEGCNHMKCTECKFQWCWLCEKEYLYGHFESGLCNGLQFEKINYLSEENENHRYYREDNNVRYRRIEEEIIHTGFFFNQPNIDDKLKFILSHFTFGWYHGNKYLEFFLSFILLFFFSAPVFVLKGFYNTYDRTKNREVITIFDHPITRRFVILISLIHFIWFQIYCTYFVILVFIFTLPTDENLFTIIRLNNYYAFRDYQRDTYIDYRYY